VDNLELKDHLKQLERKLIFISGVGLLILLMLSLISNYILKNEAAIQATSMIKRTVARDFREVVYTLNEAELNYFSAVIYFNQDGERLFSLPAALDLQTINQPSLWSRLANSRIETNLYFDPEKKNKIGSVVYVFNRFSHMPWAFAIWLLFILGTIPVIRESRQRLTKNYVRDVKLREESIRADLAQRVRHDIRSPLGALKIATQDLSPLSDRQAAIIRKATERIHEIASELELIRPTSNQIGPVSTEKQVQSVLPVVQDIIQEKRARLTRGGRLRITPHFSDEAFFLFSEFNASDLKRTISNIIENSIEACDQRGEIEVNIRSGGDTISIEIKDNGKGMPSDVLAVVGTKGFTHGKLTGTGLGLYYAKRTAEDSGGQLQVKSVEGEGTAVEILLPMAPPPRWYTNQITIPKNGTIVILDDQESSHLSLRSRLDDLKERGLEFSIEAFKRPADFLKWHRTQTLNEQSNTLYFFDYDLGRDQQNGLDLAQSLGLKSNAFLMTGHFDLSDIQNKCVVQNLKLVPKFQISSLLLNAI
jgi:signal transduction histidine kinase